MPATDAAPFGRTPRSPEAIRADARAAQDYWAGLEHLDDARRAAVLRERTPPSEQAADNTNAVAAMPPAPAVPRMPGARLGRPELESAFELRERQLWLERVENPTHELLRRLRAERDSLVSELATQNQTRPRYVRGEIHPAGMTFQRALDIAIACLDREAELGGAVEQARTPVVDGPAAPGLQVRVSAALS